MNLSQLSRTLWASFSPATNAEQHRDRAIVRTMLGAYGLKVVTLTVNLVSVPLASGYLGLERYGLWLAMSSMIGILALSDFGLGNNLTTLLAQARGREDAEEGSRHVSASVWAVGTAGAGLFLIFLAVSPWVHWGKVFNTTSAAASAEAAQAALIMGLIASTQLLAGLCQRIYAGLQQGYWGAVWSGVGSVAGLLALVMVTRVHGGLVALGLALGFVPVLVQLMGLGWVLRRGDYGRFRWPRELDWADFRHVIGGGALMFVVNLQAVFWMSKDSLLLAHTLGLDEVGRYNTAFRIYFAVFSLLVGALMSSLWPAYADAFARNDHAWIRQMLVRSLWVGTCGMACFGLVFSVFGKELLRWYVGESMSLHTVEIMLLAAYFIILTVSNAYSVLLAGSGRLAIVAWGGLVGGICSVPLCIWASHHWGLAGVISANCLSNLLCQLVPTMVQTQRLLRINHTT